MPTDPLDLPAYLRRLGWQGEAPPTLATLEALHLQHLAAIPFENLDVLLGRPIRLDLAGLQAKLVRAGRGGYCFEHNTLFAAVLRALGFQVSQLEARVRRGAETVLGRTHGVLRVDLGGAGWLVDVGFGGDGLLVPAALDGTELIRFGERHRVLPEGRLRVLQTWAEGAWRDQYAFALDPVEPIDWVVANHYTATHPDSRFTRVLTAQMPQPGLRRVLRDRTYTETRDGVTTVREPAAPEVAALLREGFGLDLPELVSLLN